MDAIASKGVMAYLRANINGLSPSERLIADYVSANIEEVPYMSMMDIAHAVGVSDATVLRFVRSIGFDSFNTFKIGLAADQTRPNESIFGEMSPDDSVELVAQKVIQADIQLLQDTMKVLDMESLNETIKAIQNAKQIYIYAAGSSIPMAEWLYDRLYRLGYCVITVTDTYRQLTQAVIAGKVKDALFIMISRSGSPIILTESQKILKAHNPESKIISITCAPKSEVAQLSDIKLNGVSYEKRRDIEGSNVAIASIINVLYTCLELADPDKIADQQKDVFQAISILRR